MREEREKEAAVSTGSIRSGQLLNYPGQGTAGNAPSWLSRPIAINCRVPATLVHGGGNTVGTKGAIEQAMLI